MTKYEHVVVPIYWDTKNYTTYLRNWKQLNEERLSKGWEVERVDELHDDKHPVLMYILRKEQNGES